MSKKNSAAEVVSEVSPLASLNAKIESIDAQIAALQSQQDGLSTTRRALELEREVAEFRENPEAFRARVVAQAAAAAKVRKPRSETKNAGISKAVFEAFADGAEHTVDEVSEPLKARFSRKDVAQCCANLVTQERLERTATATYKRPAAK